ncbi:hypothetical protein [Streptomyces spinosirectus]
MQPQRSVRNNLTFLGRLENAWAAGLADDDPGRGLTRLRELLPRFEERPEQTAGLWLSFQESLLTGPALPLLEEADLDRLRDLGERMAGTAQTGLQQSWFPLAGAVAARDRPGDRPWAEDLLTRLYRSGRAFEEARVGAAATLARWGADGDAPLGVYADLLARHARPPQEVVDQVMGLLATGFTDPVRRVERAEELARQLAATRPLPGVERTLGYGELLLHDRPAEAAERFEAALRADPNDASALHGLLAARLHAGAFTGAAGAAAGRGHLLTPRAAQLLDLCRMLAWLEEVPGAGGEQVPPPLTAGLLAATEPGPDTGPWQPYALGRAYLLEGDHVRARQHLVPLAERLPERADIAYHAAWAQLLGGERDAAAERCLDRLGRPGGWALACLLLDADPDLALPGDRSAELAAEAGGLAPVAQARVRMTAGRRPPALPEWDGLDTRGAGLPYLLEALRTMLGVEIARGRPEAAQRLTWLPLFRRLPHAERLLWHGVLALPGDPDRARELLHTARDRGRDRAGVLLAVLELKAGRTADVTALLHGVRGGRSELLRAQAEVFEGRTEAAEERLTALVRRGLPRARHAAGVLGLRQAAVHWAAGRADEAVRYAEQAAARLTDAAVTGADALPPVPDEARALARAARLLAERAARPGTGPSPWRAVRHRARTGRLLGFAQLLAEPQHVEPVLAEALTEWTGRDQAGPLAAALARGRALATAPDARAELAAALVHLAERHPVPEARRAALTTARLTALSTGAEPDTADQAGVDPVLALEAALPVLATGGHDAAVRLLRAAAADHAAGPPALNGRAERAPRVREGAPAGGSGSARSDAPADREVPVATPVAGQAVPPRTPDDGTGPEAGRARRVAGFLAGALDGGPPDGEPPADGAPGLAAPLLVARAAGLVRTDAPRAAEVLTRALAEHDVAGLVDLGRALPALCARAARGKRGGGSTEALRAAVRRQAADAADADGTALLTLVRCAAVVGDHATAEDLWRRTLLQEPEAGEEYGAYLCHRAVTAYADGDRTGALELLRKAARLLPADHPVHAEAAALERDERVDALLAVLLPDAVPGLERRGRHRLLEDLAVGRPALWRALGEDDEPGAVRELDRCLGGHGQDVPLAHAFAAVYREAALGAVARTGTAGPELVSATALWTLLLAHPGFWQEAGTPGTDTARLRKELADELLELHRTHGARCLDRQEEKAAQMHLRCLEAVRDGPAATRGLLADGPLGPVAPADVDEELFAGIAARARVLLDEWATDLVRTATERVDDPAALKRLPRGIDGDYEAGIEMLNTAVRQGFAPTSVLCTVLEWHNRWQTRLYELDERDRMREVARKAARTADLLAERSTEGRPYARENQALGMHFVDRGLLERSTQDSVRLLERAKAWDPANPSVDKLLEQARREALFGPALDHIRAKRYERALAELDRIPRNASTQDLLDTMRATTLINQGYVDMRENRFGEAEARVHDARGIAGAMTAEDGKLRQDAEQALKDVARARNAQGVGLVEQAMDRIGNLPGSGFRPTLRDETANIRTAMHHFREALRIDPELKAARDNLAAAEDIIRRLGHYGDY